MRTSRWKVWCDAASDRAARKTLDRVVSRMGVTPTDVAMGPYDEGGFVISFQLAHGSCTWAEHVVDLIRLGQRVGHGWCLSGSVDQDPEGTSNECGVPGVAMIVWQGSTNGEAP